jgi:hypothetical protein
MPVQGDDRAGWYERRHVSSGSVVRRRITGTVVFSVATNERVASQPRSTRLPTRFPSRVGPTRT